MENKILELESKIQILEFENEMLSSKSEENLLLSRIFSEINSIIEIPDIFNETIESISILLNFEFSGIFKGSKKSLESINSYLMHSSIDNPTTHLTINNLQVEGQIFSESQYINHDTKALELCFESEIKFEPKAFLLIPIKTTMYDNYLFICADSDPENIDESKKALLEKIINILSSRIEYIYYHQELERMNKEISQTNQKLNNTNIELSKTLQTLKETQAQLVQNEKMTSLGILTAGVAHEINNPLNYILGAYTGLMKIHTEKSYQQNSNKLNILLDSLKIGVDRATNIVVGLNQFSRNNESQDEDCHLHQIIDNCLSIINNQLKHRIEIEKNYSPNEIIVKGNVGNLHQVFINLLSNAEQAIAKSGIIKIGTQIKDAHVLISIEDNGEGISKENLSKISDPFFTTKDPGKGTGLGLSIVYNIIKEYNGTITFESTIKKGTKVLINIPNN